MSAVFSRSRQREARTHTRVCVICEEDWEMEKEEVNERTSMIKTRKKKKGWEMKNDRWRVVPLTIGAHRFISLSLQQNAQDDGDRRRRWRRCSCACAAADADAVDTAVSDSGDGDDRQWS